MTIAALLLAAAAATEPCSRAEWDRSPARCLQVSGLGEPYKDFAGQVMTFAASAGLAQPQVRPTILLIRERFAEVEQLKDGAYEIRIDATDLNRPPSFRAYFAAHEVCHILNGDAQKGVWAVLDRTQRDDRHRWVEACSLELLGDGAYAAYLRRHPRLGGGKWVGMMQAVQQDRHTWNRMRREAHTSVP